MHHLGDDVLVRLEDAMTEGPQRRSDGAGNWPDDGARPVVVVGVDGSPASRCAALTAGGSARRLGGSVVAVHVPTFGPWHAMAACLGAGQALVEAAEVGNEQIRSELAALFELVDVPWRFVVACGAVDVELSRIAAELHAAMVVVGAPRRTLGARLAHLVVPDVPRMLLRSGTNRLLVA
jgi:nucleotide-binding universal stress UspA family protein